MIGRVILAIALLALAASSVQASDFVQGPDLGHRSEVGGRVIGWNVGDCVVLIVDQAGRPGLAGGGRLVLCGTSLGMDDRFQGPVRQTGTRMLRIGSAWRVVPIVVPASAR